MKIQEKATQFLSQFRVENGRVCTNLDNEELTDLIRHVHGQTLPDDWIYEQVRDSLQILQDAPADADFDDVGSFSIEADIYTSHLKKWFATYNEAEVIIDELVSGGVIWPDTDTLTRIQIAQASEKERIFSQVVDFLRTLCAEEAA